MKDIALFEYDDDREAVINPDHENFNIKLPEIAVFAFVGEAVDDYTRENHASSVAEFFSITKTYQIYVVNFNGKDICLSGTVRCCSCNTNYGLVNFLRR